MNNQFFNANNVNNPTVTVAPPIVTRQVNVVHRYFVVEQPHICEQETKICNHYIKRHKYIPRPICNEYCDYVEENQGCCPGFNNNPNNNPDDNNFNNLFG